MNNEQKENIRYYFKQVSTEPQDEKSASMLRASFANMIKHLGVTYGNYTIRADNVIWKAPVSEDQAIEIQNVDRETFKVLFPTYSNFYLIHSTSI